MIDTILSTLTNPVILGGLGLAVLLLIGLVFFKKKKPQKEIMYCRDRDMRGERLPINEESPVSLRVKRKSKSILSRSATTLRFIKVAGAYVFNEGGKMITRFFAKEGTAFTWWLEGGELKIGTLMLTLKGLWGETFYDEIPEEQRKVVEEANVYVTVKLGEGLTPTGFSSIKEDDIQEEDEKKAASLLASGLKERTSGRALYEGILWACAGALAMFIAFNFGIFK